MQGTQDKLLTRPHWRSCRHPYESGDDPANCRPGFVDPGTFEIIAGERRWRAAQRAGLHTVPIVSLDANDQEALELSIIENVQRSDLNALEEAKGFSQLAAEYGYSHTDIGRVIGKSRSHVANTLRLLSLSPHVKTLLIKGDISSGHARALLTVENADEMADRIVAEGLSVREIEKNGSEELPSAPRAKAEQESDPVTKDLENRISNALGTKIFIQNTKRSRELRIRFKDFDQLQYICEKLLQN